MARRLISHPTPSLRHSQISHGDEGVKKSGRQRRQRVLAQITVELIVKRTGNVAQRQSETRSRDTKAPRCSSPPKPLVQVSTIILTTWYKLSTYRCKI